MAIFIPDEKLNEAAVASIWRRARQGVCDHTSVIPMSEMPYFKSCMTVLEGYAKIIFTRESGYHACGWWKNPMYDRCFHLSLSFLNQSDRRRHAPEIVRAIYHDRDWRANIWTEPPHSNKGKALEVYHYRVMVDPNDPTWQTPICPRKEVYSKDWTGPRWQSWSEANAR